MIKLNWRKYRETERETVYISERGVISMQTYPKADDSLVYVVLTSRRRDPYGRFKYKKDALQCVKDLMVTDIW
jgi:hypothetical protein